MLAERSRCIRVLSWCVLLGVSIAAPAAAAPRSKRACAASFEKAQEEQKRGKLLVAERLLIACTARSCGGVVQRECAALLEELKPRIPSIVLSVTDESGRSLTDVDVTMDGKPLADALDGRARRVDPGVHTFVLAGSDGVRSAEQAIVLEAASHQKFSFTMPDPPAPPAAAVAEKDEPSPEPAPAPKPVAVLPDALPARPSPGPAPAGRGPSVLPYVFGGVGVLGVAGFAVLGSIGNAEEQKLPECWPSCAESRVERVRTLYLAADISLGVGAAAIATSVVLFLTGGSSSEEPPRAPRRSAAIDVRPTRGGAVAGVSGAF